MLGELEEESEFVGPTHEGLYRLIRENLTLERIAEILDIKITEAHRKCTNQRGFTLGQFAKLLDAVGVRIATRNEVVLSQQQHAAYLTMTRMYTDLQLQNINGITGQVDRRREVTGISQN